MPYTSAYNTAIQNLERVTAFYKLSEAFDYKSDVVEEYREQFLEQAAEDLLNRVPESIQKDKLGKSLIDIYNKSWQEHVAGYQKLRCELSLVQLVATADVYKEEITKLLLVNNMAQYNIDFMVSYLNLKKADLISSGYPISYDAIMQRTDWHEHCNTHLANELEKLTRQVAYEKWIDKICSQFLPNFTLVVSDKFQLSEAIATRNILIHKRGIIDSEYLERSRHWYIFAQATPPGVGTIRIIDNKYYEEISLCLKRVITAIDSEVSNIHQLIS